MNGYVSCEKLALTKGPLSKGEQMMNTRKIWFQKKNLVSKKT